MCKDQIKCSEIISKSQTKFGDQFIFKSKIIHGDKYDYSKSLYRTAQKKVIIICNTCLTEFLQSPIHHLRGNGCTVCWKERVKIRKECNKEQFIEKAISKHGDKYDYSEAIYVNLLTHIKILCKE